MPLFVFNPEHDLCLANGNMHYVPPESARIFAHVGKEVMRIVYGDDAVVVAADEYSAWREHGGADDTVVPWGWNTCLKQMLLRQGASEEHLLSDDRIEKIRQLQNRTTIAPLQPHARTATSVEETKSWISYFGSAVLKAPWSGSGWGVRRVCGTLSDQDISWLKKILNTQHAVVVEKEYERKDDFAFEFKATSGNVEMAGLSLFSTQNGRYRYNWLLYDDEIRVRLEKQKELMCVENTLLQWLRTNVAPLYDGWIGVDLFRTIEDEFVVAEMNVRHTMGWVSHCFLGRHPECHGKQWSPKRGLMINS